MVGALVIGETSMCRGDEVDPVVPYFETDPRALAWYERALTHGVPRIRLGALRLLARVDCADRSRWLRGAQLDAVPEVVAAAVLIEATAPGPRTVGFDLFESDFATGLGLDDLTWEWEFEVAVAHGMALQGLSHRVWTADEDDTLARRLTLLRAYAGKEHEVDAATALIVDKRVVNQYTRSPRTRAEALRWHVHGRPRYSGP